MGYSCPVCGSPQTDARHLANHVAFTALLRGGDHEAWLDETVPEWSEHDETALAAALEDHVDEVDVPTAPEPTEPLEPKPAPESQETMPEMTDERAREILSEAADLTRRRRSDSETE